VDIINVAFLRRLFLNLYEAKNAGIALAMTSIFNEIEAKKKPS